ncbi:class I SAM-dependent methyltransferase [Devosia sediminis]|uniref:Class I SAM-dependent methyltransferase n=1 Tax=Devosia sediminis TaxID=2798801 RepID=A0A934MLA3_9HYPH|nr:class I SAM-dependent methyltransferase [Devosia sediminis]MBJ3784950.1 class I SAM-dependent methyltransferase [Devosia sediminis]
MSDWHAYHQTSAQLPPRELLLKALEVANGPARATDIGCGSGRDTLHLVAEGWEVEALDSSAEALALLAAKTPPAARGRLTLTQATMEDATLRPARLVYAAMSLPFCAPSEAPALWSRIAAAVEPGGVFAGHFFGPRDAWAANGLWTLSRLDLDTMLSGWSVLHLTEFEGMRTTATGHEKWSHIFEVVARR